MGDLTNTTFAIDSAEILSKKHVHLDFQKHVGAPQNSPHIVLANVLRARHPKLHVIEFSSSTCDLASYAAAGHAKSELQYGDDAFENTIGYEAPEFRLDAASNPGKLKDYTKFGCWRYEWEGVTYLRYHFEYITFLDRPQSLDYVLAPLENETTSKNDGHHQSIDKLLFACGQWTTRLHEEVYVFDGGRWTKNKALWKSVQNSSWDDVILDAAQKKTLIDDVYSFFDSRELYQNFQVPWKRGLIFHGLPGNGKTISLTALMAALYKRDDPVPSLYVKSFEGCNPQTSQQNSIRQIFQNARKMAPCLLIFEDLDSLITDTTRSYFLNEVDGIESNDGILMIGSTNHLDKLDPAIRDRPSRFDRKYYFRLPEEPERTAYAGYWKQKLSKNSQIDFPDTACQLIARMTDGFSFAYMKELFVAALLTVARGGTGDEPPVPDPSVPSAAAAAVEEKKAPEPPKEESKEEAKEEKTDKEEAKDKKKAAKEAAAKLEAEEQAKRLEEARVRKEALAAIEIPEELQSNVFVKVIYKQVGTLLDEMGSSKPEKRQRVANSSSSGGRWIYYGA